MSYSQPHSPPELASPKRSPKEPLEGGPTENTYPQVPSSPPPSQILFTLQHASMSMAVAVPGFRPASTAARPAFAVSPSPPHSPTDPKIQDQYDSYSSASDSSSSELAPIWSSLPTPGYDALSSLYQRPAPRSRAASIQEIGSRPRLTSYSNLPADPVLGSIPDRSGGLEYARDDEASGSGDHQSAAANQKNVHANYDSPPPRPTLETEYEYRPRTSYSQAITGYGASYVSPQATSARSIATHQRTASAPSAPTTSETSHSGSPSSPFPRVLYGTYRPYPRPNTDPAHQRTASGSSIQTASSNSLRIAPGSSPSPSIYSPGESPVSRVGSVVSPSPISEVNVSSPLPGRQRIVRVQQQIPRQPVPAYIRQATSSSIATKGTSWQRSYRSPSEPPREKRKRSPTQVQGRRVRLRMDNMLDESNARRETLGPRVYDEVSHIMRRRADSEGPTTTPVRKGLVAISTSTALQIQHPLRPLPQQPVQIQKKPSGHHSRKLSSEQAQRQQHQQQSPSVAARVSQALPATLASQQPETERQNTPQEETEQEAIPIHSPIPSEPIHINWLTSGAEPANPGLSSSEVQRKREHKRQQHPTSSNPIASQSSAENVSSESWKSQGMSQSGVAKCASQREPIIDTTPGGPSMSAEKAKTEIDTEHDDKPGAEINVEDGDSEEGEEDKKKRERRRMAKGKWKARDPELDEIPVQPTFVPFTRKDRPPLSTLAIHEPLLSVSHDHPPTGADHGVQSAPVRNSLHGGQDPQLLQEQLLEFDTARHGTEKAAYQGQSETEKKTQQKRLSRGYEGSQPIALEWMEPLNNPDDIRKVEEQEMRKLRQERERELKDKRARDRKIQLERQHLYQHILAVLRSQVPPVAQHSGSRFPVLTENEWRLERYRRIQEASTVSERTGLLIEEEKIIRKTEVEEATAYERSLLREEEEESGSGSDRNNPQA